MRRWMIAGNWKMHNTIEESKALAGPLPRHKRRNGRRRGCRPCFHGLSAVADAIKGSKVGLAAQNVYFEDKGAYTGEVAPGHAQGCGLSVRDYRPFRAEKIFRRDG